MGIDGDTPKRIGLVVNPIAGMGGAVGLKGTDGRAVLEKARELGAKPIAPERAEIFLTELRSLQKGIHLIVAPRMMGEEEARNHSFPYTTVGEKREETTAEDTKAASRAIVKAEADLLVFCGGDGTARDVMDAVDKDLPVLGVPTGVKMHSAVFAVGPRAAARLAIEFLWGHLPLREAEVMDIDEEAFREGRLSAALHGYLLVPYDPRLVQNSKVATPTTDLEIKNQAAIAIHIIEEMDEEIIYIIGPGTTTRIIADLLHEEKTLLGVDLFYNKRLIAKDVNEEQILERISGKDAKIIVTPIGGQGFIFGRGNQQISSRVIREVGLENLIVIATRHKIRGLRQLRVDTGDSALDEQLQGYLKVTTDYRESRMIKVV